MGGLLSTRLITAALPTTLCPANICAGDTATPGGDLLSIAPVATFPPGNPSAPTAVFPTGPRPDPPAATPGARVSATAGAGATTNPGDNGLGASTTNGITTGPSGTNSASGQTPSHPPHHHTDTTASPAHRLPWQSGFPPAPLANCRRAARLRRNGGQP